MKWINKGFILSDVICEFVVFFWNLCGPLSSRQCSFQPLMVPVRVRVIVQALDKSKLLPLLGALLSCLHDVSGLPLIFKCYGYRVLQIFSSTTIISIWPSLKARCSKNLPREKPLLTYLILFLGRWVQDILNRTQSTDDVFFRNLPIFPEVSLLQRKSQWLLGSPPLW